MISVSERSERPGFTLGKHSGNSRTHGAGAPLKVAGCEYRLERRKIDGREQPCIVCEDIVI
jgi:hypothetical protein